MNKISVALMSVFSFIFLSSQSYAMCIAEDLVDGGDGYVKPQPVYEEIYEATYEEPVYEDETVWEEPTYTYEYSGRVLAPGIGTVYGPTGKETYYNMDMSTLVSWARSAGYSEEDYPYWIRDDGCKMLGQYIMCAANLNHFPRYSLVESSLGTCIVVDTGDFAYWDEGWSWLDIAVTW